MPHTHDLSLFDAKGIFHFPDAAAIAAAGLSDDDMVRLEEVRDAYELNQRAKSEADDLAKEISAVTNMLAQARTEERRVHPPKTHIQAAREWIATQRMQR